MSQDNQLDIVSNVKDGFEVRRNPVQSKILKKNNPIITLKKEIFFFAGS